MSSPLSAYEGQVTGRAVEGGGGVPYIRYNERVSLFQRFWLKQKVSEITNRDAALIST